MSRKSLSNVLYSVLLLATVGGGIYYRFVLKKGGDAESAEPVVRAPASAAFANRGIASAPGPGDATPAASASPPADAPAESAISADDKDAELVQALASLVGDAGPRSLFKSDYLARRIVLTVDGLAHRRQTQADYLALHNPKGIYRPGQASTFARYKPYVTLARSIDLNTVVATYHRIYPLLQAAYRDLDPRREFNDRLIAVIDHLLEDPFAHESAAALDPTNSGYRFQDPRFEKGLSSGQKILFRMGPDNAADVRLTLRNLRLLLKQ